jgi:hypothetical protein
MHVVAVFGHVMLLLDPAFQAFEKQCLHLLRQSLRVEVQRINWLIAMVAAVPAFKMKTAMVAKHRRQRALLVAGRAIFHALDDLVATAMAKFGAGDNFSRAIGTKFHVRCISRSGHKFLPQNTEGFSLGEQSIVSQ